MWLAQHGMNILIIFTVACYGVYILRKEIKALKSGTCTGCGGACSGCNSCQAAADEQLKVIRSRTAH